MQLSQLNGDVDVPRGAALTAPGATAQSGGKEDYQEHEADDQSGDGAGAGASTGGE